MWIQKPYYANCGRGIKIVNNIKKFKDEFIRNKAANNALNTLR